jgi:hypothetical protein
MVSFMLEVVHCKNTDFYINNGLRIGKKAKICIFISYRQKMEGTLRDILSVDDRLLAAFALRDGRAKGIELVGIERRDHAQAGICGGHGRFLSAQATIKPGMSPNIGSDGHSGKSMFGFANGIMRVSGNRVSTRTLRNSREIPSLTRSLLHSRKFLNVTAGAQPCNNRLGE